MTANEQKLFSDGLQDYCLWWDLKKMDNRCSIYKYLSTLSSFSQTSVFGAVAALLKKQMILEKCYEEDRKEGEIFQ